MVPGYTICTASSDRDLLSIRHMFEAYAASLPVDLAYQGFEQEVEGLPGQYASPRGKLLLGRSLQGKAIGCIALRPLAEPGLCEMKRLYVDPAARGSGLGRALIRALVAEACRIGYSRMHLDTLPSMSAARNLYREFGFEPIAPYYETPVAGTAFLSIAL